MTNSLGLPCTRDRTEKPVRDQKLMNNTRRGIIIFVVQQQVELCVWELWLVLEGIEMNRKTLDVLACACDGRH